MELGITAEDLITAEEQDVVSSPRRLPVVDSDSEVTKALVCLSCICISKVFMSKKYLIRKVLEFLSK